MSVSNEVVSVSVGSVVSGGGISVSGDDEVGMHRMSVHVSVPGKGSMVKVSEEDADDTEDRFSDEKEMVGSHGNGSLVELLSHSVLVSEYEVELRRVASVRVETLGVGEIGVGRGKADAESENEADGRGRGCGPVPEDDEQ